MRRIFCVVFLLVTVRLCWAGSIGTSGGPILRQPIGARQIGMGEAFVAVADDVNTIYWNPAGLSFLVAPEVSAMYSKSIVDTTYGTFAFNYPIYKGGIFGQRRNAIGLGFVFLNGGDIDIIMGSPTSTPERLKAEQDYVFILGYSEMLSELKLFGKPGNLFMGLNAKLIRSTLAEDYSATAFAFDYGHFYQTGKISVGFALQNFGSDIKYIEKKDPLPLTGRLGISYETKLFQKQQFIRALLDLVKSNDDGLKTHIGLEYRLREILSVRAGYKIGYALDSITCGVGFGLKGYRLDYALGFMGELDYTHRMSFSVKLGQPERVSRSLKRDFSSPPKNYIYGQGL